MHKRGMRSQEEKKNKKTTTKRNKEIDEIHQKSTIKRTIEESLKAIKKKFSDGGGVDIQ